MNINLDPATAKDFLADVSALYGQIESLEVALEGTPDEDAPKVFFEVFSGVPTWFKPYAYFAAGTALADNEELANEFQRLAAEQLFRAWSDAQSPAEEQQAA